ncbi:MAG: hypothetical protein NC453_28615, partial [Muribaculum sp.]|nr:hypothetical protein [Muribaculum sp.]
MTRQRNDATASAQGMVFQFFAALHACFEMNEGDKVYIEKYGDVTTISPQGSTQVKVKKRGSYLSEYSDEIWNTIYNWLVGDISWKDFSSLILLTTQKVYKGKVWDEWNTMNQTERVLKFKELLSGKPKLSSNKKQLLQSISSLLNDEDLKLFVKKIFISTTDDTLDSWYNKLGNRILGVPKLRKKECLNELVGFLANKGLEQKNWVITYTDFHDHLEHLYQTMIETTTEFPKLIDVNPDIDDYQEKRFISKLKEIHYDDNDVLSLATLEYVTAIEHPLLFSVEPYRIAQLENYETNICGAHTAHFRKARLECGDDVYKSSQIFYESFKGRPVENFGTFTNTPIRFRNGIVQILANEDRISWLLKSPNVTK